MEKKGCSKVLVVVLLIALIAAGGYIAYQYKAYNDLKKDCTKSVVIGDTKEESKNGSTTEDDSLNEGYIIYGKEGKFHIYGIGEYVTANQIVVGYENTLYKVYGDRFNYISKIPTVTFDAEGNYSEDSVPMIHKYSGSESNLAKVVYSRSVFGTDGSPYPILIYKDGSVETGFAFDAAFKNYKIKDFISEECVGRGANNLCNAASYEVMLFDGTTTKIQYNEQ